MARTSAHGAWNALPATIRRILARGSVGREHLAGLTGELLGVMAGQDRAGRNRLGCLAQEALCAAWSAAPLSCDIGQLLSGLPLPERTRLPEAVSTVLSALPSFWRAPVESDAWWTFGAGEQRREQLLARMAQEPKNLFWKSLAWGHAWQRADWELSELALRPASWPRVLTPLRLQAAALHLLAQGEAKEALAALDGVGAFYPGGTPGLRAECLQRLGRTDEAVSVLAGAVGRSPFHTSELLRLVDLISGASQEVQPVPGSVAVLLYTWNKALELDETLASLAASELQGARIWVLDNGSSDGTPGVLADWSQRFGDSLTTLRLPVNIGAPAARNWLLSLPEVRNHEYLVFLDDDVSLPADWLGRLGAAATLFSEASVWGCRVVDEANPLVLQSVDYVPHAPRSQRDPGLLLSLPTIHLGQADFGQFGYMRPCVSVTGCCHMLRSAHIDATGGFDIRFSPSQYDDLERDLRVFLGGGHAVYQGHLAVRHKRRSGAMAERSPAEVGCAMANLRKVEAKHGEAQLAALSEAGEAMLERDMERRFRQFDEHPPLG